MPGDVPRALAAESWGDETDRKVWMEPRPTFAYCPGRPRCGLLSKVASRGMSGCDRIGPATQFP